MLRAAAAPTTKRNEKTQNYQINCKSIATGCDASTNAFQGNCDTSTKSCVQANKLNGPILFNVIFAFCFHFIFFLLVFFCRGRFFEKCSRRNFDEFFGNAKQLPTCAYKKAQNFLRFNRFASSHAYRKNELLNNIYLTQNINVLSKFWNNYYLCVFV